MTRHKFKEFGVLEHLAAGQSVIHRLHPAAKILSTLVFILTVLTIHRHNPDRLVPFIFYPTLLMALSSTPYAPLLRRLVVALPFCLFAGLGNVFIERETAFQLGSFTVTLGALSLTTVLLRAYLCVMAALILISVTPFSALTAALRRFRIPDILVVSFEMTYRYIGVLAGEGSALTTAYALRGGDNRGIRIRHMGSLLGQWLLRSLDRAERIYHAMCCRGYAMKTVTKMIKFTVNDMLFLLITITFCIFFRWFNPGSLWTLLAWRLA